MLMKMIWSMRMMISFPELQEKWDKITNTAENYILVSGDHTLSFHIGYNNLKQRSFVVYNTGKIDDIPNSKSISAKCINADSGVYSLQFSLQYLSFSEMFTLLCWDLMDNSDLETGAINALVERYKKWQKLLQKASVSLLSNNEIKGLIGELLFLSQYIELYGEEKSILGWLGPDGADQDYIFPDCWFEIKATTISANEVGISSLQQLERTDNGRLVVYFMDKTSPNDPTACSLASVISEIDTKLKSQKMRDKFWCKKKKKGCLKYQIERYYEPKYRISENRIYNVAISFPRLSRANVPPEVTTVKYSLSLAAIEKYRIQRK